MNKLNLENEEAAVTGMFHDFKKTLSASLKSIDLSIRSGSLTR